jgi:hypothetical protein
VSFKKGRGRIVIGEFEYDYHPAFKLVLTCNIHRPSLSPDVFSATTVIDFALTEEGL